ncbi:MAG: creatininase family protein [Bacteroidota bacterium]
MTKQIILLVAFCLMCSCSSTVSRNSPEEELVEYTLLTPSDFRQRISEAPIAYLPLGTIEWHGEHLPLGSDGLQSFEFMKLLAREAGGIVLPMLYLGPDSMRIIKGEVYYGMDHILNQEDRKEYYPEQQLDGSCYWVPDELFKSILENSIQQLARAGFKIIVAHGHGPSTQTVLKYWEEWEEKYGVLIYTCWASNVRGEYDEESSSLAGEGIGIMTDHAARNETSLMMYFYPDLVRMDLLPADTAQWPVGVWGVDPREYASLELGRQAVDYHLERMKGVLESALESLH